MSVKGVILDRGRAVLLRNERGEWELPGGRLEAGESPEECVAREVQEELNLAVEVGPLLDAWVYEVLPGARVLVLAYGCFVEDFAGMAYSAEHSDLGFFGVDDLVDVTFVTQKRVAFASSLAISPARRTPSARFKRALRLGGSAYTSSSAGASAKEEDAWGREQEETVNHENGSKG